jgi:hypothetical protein
MGVVQAKEWTIERKNLLEEVKKIENIEFKVQFTKKDGTNRIMSCIYGVKTDGPGLSYDPEKKGLIVVFDLEKEEYRMIPVATVRKLWIGDDEFDITDNGVACNNPKKKLIRR